MATYLIFFRFTEKGIADIGKSPERVQDAKETVRKCGGEFKTFFALTGTYDTLFIIAAPDEGTAATIALAIASEGNVRTEIVRAFTEEEFAKIASAASS